MADKSRYQSWNPLNYSQNLCVVSNPSVSSEQTNDLMTSRATDSLLVDQISAIDQQSNKMVNELIESSEKELAISSVTDISGNRCNAATNAFECGDFGFNFGHKLNNSSLTESGLKQMDAFSSGATNHSVFNQMQCIPNPNLMSSQTYSEVKSLPQSFHSFNQLHQTINSRYTGKTDGHLMNPMASLADSGHNMLANTATSSLNNSLTKQLIDSLTSNLTSSCRVTDQTLVAPKPNPSLPYIRNQGSNTFQMSQIQQFMEMPNNDMQAISGRPVRSIRARNASQSGTEPIKKLNHFFEKCCEQFRHLEKERKKIESELIHSFPGQKISSANNIPIQRMPQNASKIDKVITDMYREHAKVLTLVEKMEQLNGREFDEEIHNSIQKWLELTRLLQIKRKYEAQKSVSEPMAVSLPDDSLIEQMNEIMKSLFRGIRSVRTSLWCSLVVTLYDQTLS